MDFEKQRFTIQQIKAMDMVDYLSTLGFAPSQTRGSDYWYLSPLRQENTPSFKINRALNRWYDHGMGRGGNLVDFGVLFYNCTVAEFIKSLNSNFPLHQPPLAPHSQTVPSAPQRRIKIANEFSLSSRNLIRYLEHRRIAIEVAQKYCLEVRYQLGTKTYYGIGFRNDLGGFEIRNPYYKLSSSPKGITTFRNGAKEVIVFEGFIDFLSFKTMHQNLLDNQYDFLILNSVSFFESARAFLEEHHRIILFLDRDKTGQNCSQYACSLSEKYEDHSSLYRLHKDFNDWIMNFGRHATGP